MNAAMDTPEEREPILLGGRGFLPVERTTVEHDHWYMRQVRAAGLDGVQPLEGESHEAFALRLLALTIESERGLLLLSGLIVPVDAPGGRWSPELAKQTVAFLEQLDDPLDKNQVSGLVAAMLADFFAAGLISSGASALSSALQPDDLTQLLSTRRGASGPKSSAQSPGTTRSARSPSTAGPWWRRWWPFARSGSAKPSTTTATAASCGP